MDEYRALMEEVKSPNSVHEDILSEIGRARRAERRTRVPHARRPPAAPRRRRWLPLAAAGVCALVIAVALIPLGTGKAPGVSQSFSVQAYASGTRTLVPPTEDGMIVFDRSGNLTTADKDWCLRYGKYTGCMFTVKGEGIVRIQATTSAGMFYRNSYETVNGRDDPERVAELSLWKPTKAGLGEYYGLYENVEIIDGFGVPDPDRDITVKLTKMLGSTIDLPIDEQDDSDAKSFGLWTNADYGDVADSAESPLANTDAVFDTFDGQTITVTAYFEDGSCATQTIELHTADFKAQMDDPDAFYGYGDITIYPEIVDRSTLPNVYAPEVGEDGACFWLHSLYGVIVDETEGPHPYPLDNANEWLNDTVPFVFDRASTFEPVENAVIGEDSIYDPSSSVIVSVPENGSWASQDSEPRELEVANLRLERSAQLPFGLAVEDTIEYAGYRGDMAYANKVSEEQMGYRIEDDGSLTPGFSYRTVTFEATNRSDSDVSLYTAALGDLAVLDDNEGHFSRMASRVMWTTGFDAATNSGWDCVLAPGETRELSVVYVVSDELDEQDDPLFCLSSYQSDSVAFRIKSLL